MPLDVYQRQAVEAAVKSKLICVTGPPGTGKTFTIASIMSELQEKYKYFMYDFAICAPTGKAAKRLTESIPKEASTIHRLLKWNPITEGFDYNRENPLHEKVVIVDETSMVDISLMARLCEALHKDSRLILIGDADQLPSVGPGNVFRDSPLFRFWP